MNVPVGQLTASISQPSYGQVIPLGSDFVLQLSCKRTENEGWGDWMPEKNLALTVKLEQGANKAPVSISSTLSGQPSSVMSDSDGIVSLLIAADNSVLETGSAELVVYWTDPYSSEEVNTSIPVYLGADDSESLIGVGLQVIIDGPLSSSEPGEEIIMTVNTLDMAGNPLAGIWVHHLTSRSTTTSEEDRGRWTMQQSDNQGKLTVLVTIPLDLNPGSGSILLYATAKNATGVSDSDYHQVRLIEPRVSLNPSTVYWLPGDEVQMKIDVDDMSGQVAAFWSVEELGLEGKLTFAANSQGSFSFQVPERASFSYLQISVIVIDTSGETDSDSFSLHRLDGYSLMISPPNEVIAAGDKITFAYVITAMDSTEPVEYPMSWTIMVSGVADSAMTGLVNSDSGSIEYTLPSNLESGSYLFAFIFESQSTHLVIDVRSNDDASGVGGTFSAVGDSLDSASGWVSTLALIMVFVCLGLLLKGGGKKEEEWSGSGFNDPLPVAAPSHIAAVPAPMPAANPAPQYAPPAAIPAAQPPPAAMPAYDPTSPTGYAHPPPQQ